MAAPAGWLARQSMDRIAVDSLLKCKLTIVGFRGTHFYRNYFLADSECPQTDSEFADICRICSTDSFEITDMKKLLKISKLIFFSNIDNICKMNEAVRKVFLY